MEDENFLVELTGEIDLTKAEARDNGLFTGEGTGEMTLVLKDGEKETTITVHKLSFEGTLTKPS